MTYTKHGYHILGTKRSDELGHIPKIRCGGPALCTVCQKDVAAEYTKDAPTIEEEYPFEDTSEYDFDPDRFLKQAKLFAIGAHNNSIDDGAQQLSIDNLYIVWFTKTLGNWKALISTNNPGDGLYFEVTHNSEKEETYVDTYVKLTNDTFSQEGEMQ